MILKPEVNEKDHMQGNPKAPIELVEYGDYQCPYCAKAHYMIQKLQKGMGEQMKFVFRNFPLYDAHPNALHAATAAEVAADQGKFWEMHDILFENQDRLEDDYLMKYAGKIGLDTKKFEADFSNPKYAEKIEADLESGLRSGVNGTPSFYVNGQKYTGEYSAEALMEYMQALS